MAKQPRQPAPQPVPATRQPYFRADSQPREVPTMRIHEFSRRKVARRRRRK
jgi:hypothetical protein